MVKEIQYISSSNYEEENKDELKKKLEEIVKILNDRIIESDNRIKELEALRKEKMELLFHIQSHIVLCFVI